jgi:hypothetical protein
MTQSELIDLEQQGWQALSTTAENAIEFYSRVLDHTAVMLLPGGMILNERAAIMNSMAGQPWSSFELQDMQVLQLTQDTAIVAYGVTAQRENAPSYSALISSVYARRQDGWKLAFHQQTPR